MVKSYLPEKGDDKDLIDALSDIDREADHAVKDRITNWDRSVRVFRNGSVSTPTPPPIFQANILAPLFERKSALLTEMKPQLDVRPTRNGLTKTAEIMKRTIEAGWDEQNLGLELQTLSLTMNVLASAFMSCDWNPHANYGLGNIECLSWDPRNVRVDPAIRRAKDLDDAQYIRTRIVVPLSQAQTQYPDVAADLKTCSKIAATDRDDTTPTQASPVRGAIERAKRKMGIGGANTPMAVPRVELFCYQLADPASDDDGPLYPGGRVIVRNEDIICEDRQNQYYDGRWNMEWLDNGPDLDTAWGRDEVEAIRRVQQAFNRLGNSAVRATLQNAIQILSADQNAVPVETVNAFREMGFYFVEKVATRTFERLPAPVQIPTILSFMQFLMGLGENLAGLQDAAGNIATTKGRAEVRSTAMLEGLQQASQVLIRAQARRLEAFLERLGQKWVSRIFQFFTTDRLMTFIGSDGLMKEYSFEREKLLGEIIDLARKRIAQQQQEERHRTRNESDDMPPADVSALRGQVIDLPVASKEDILAAVKGAWRDFRFRIVPYSSLAQNRILRSQLLKQLNAEAKVPARLEMEELGFENAQDLLKEAVAEAQERQALGIMPPQPQPGKKKPKS